MTESSIKETRVDGELTAVEVVLPLGSFLAPKVLPGETLSLHMPAVYAPFAEWLIKAWDSR